MEKNKILIIEDDADTRQFLEAMLSKDFNVLIADNGVLGVEYARNRNPDLILLDVILPVISGFDACSLLKKDDVTKHIPIIFLTARNSITDMTQGLSAGADDYVSKPFDYKELFARIKVRLRQRFENMAKPIHVGSLEIDIANREVLYEGKKTQLTLTEFDILRCLASKVGMVVSRDQILTEVWRDNPDGPSDRTIDVHIRSLRRKIPSLAKHIISIYGVGYKYEL